MLWWRAGRGDEARAAWGALVTANGDERDAALAALVMVDGAQRAASLERGRMAQWRDELLLALALRGDPQARAALASRMSSVEVARQTAALTALFAPPSER
ncbi:MAG: hypothetical protein IPG43_21360 [Proteobacteria bacterium]|nr:hypothetical protein [Pseudomonadota bacterium]